MRGKCLSIYVITQNYALNLKHAIKNIIYTMVALYWTMKGCFLYVFELNQNVYTK